MASSFEDIHAEPREYNGNLFSMSCSNEVFEAIEEMELKLEEMQLYCEEQRKEAEKLEHILIERDSKHCQEKDRLHEEIMSLKKKYVEDIKVKCCKEHIKAPAWLCESSLERDEKVNKLESQVSNLMVALMERDSKIKTLEWHLKDAEANVTSLTAERSKLALETDELAMKLEEYEYATQFGQMRTSHHQHMSKRSSSSTDYDGSLRNLYSSIQSIPESELENEDEDAVVDNLPGLVRAANFSNICALDESLDFKMEIDKLSCASGSTSDSLWTRTPSTQSLQSSVPSLQSLYQPRAETSLNMNISDSSNFLRVSSNASLDGKFDTYKHSLQAPLKSWKPIDLDSGFDSDAAFGGTAAMCSSQPSNKSDLFTFEPVHVVKCNPTSSKLKFSDSYRKSKENPVLKAFSDDETVENSSFEDDDLVLSCKTEPGDAVISKKELRTCFSDDFSELPIQKIERCSGRLNLLEDEDLSNCSIESLNDNEFADRENISVETLEKTTEEDDMWGFEPESIVDVSTGEHITHEELRKRSDTCNLEDRRKRTLRQNSDEPFVRDFEYQACILQRSKSVDELRSDSLKAIDCSNSIDTILNTDHDFVACEMDRLNIASNRSLSSSGETPSDPQLAKVSVIPDEKPIKGQNISERSRAWNSLRCEPESCEVLHVDFIKDMQTETNIWNSSHSQSSNDMDDFSLMRRNSYHSFTRTTPVPRESGFRRNQSDPRYGKRETYHGKSSSGLAAYNEWLKEGKSGEPPVTITEC